ncbi:6943_t:CDS:2 [Racocetra fulgida]|uniref:6943_t:CDS:1 n=1 Tax=Racocetra fulgida TaxID=60492 RepID=A0A9N9C8A8_9GLOM|nr:6943_t:CDS:2 [Racocetra fulgida]
MDKSAASTNQSTPAAKNTNPSLSLPNIDSNTKAYIEAACQASSNMIISTIKEYIDQTLDAHMVLINKLNTRIDSSLNQQKQSPQLTHPTQNPQDTAATHNHTFNLSSPQQTNRPNDNSNTQQGNCPLTPLLNNLLIDASNSSQYNERDITTQATPHTNKAIKIKTTMRKFPSFEYTEDLPPVDGFERRCFYNKHLNTKQPDTTAPHPPKN